MAVWDLNSNLDVFSMQTFLRGLIYVRWAIQAHLSLYFFLKWNKKIGGWGAIVWGGFCPRPRFTYNFIHLKQFCIFLIFWWHHWILWVNIFSFSRKNWNSELKQNAALRRKRKDWLAWNRDNVSEWINMYIHELLFQWASTIQIQLSVLV